MIRLSICLAVVLLFNVYVGIYSSRVHGWTKKKNWLNAFSAVSSGSVAHKILEEYDAETFAYDVFYDVKTFTATILLTALILAVPILSAKLFMRRWSKNDA